ncbi:glucose 1-dehydrogenase [Lentibacter algarum]|uniref:SDR family NAD(P)-dependent oxidoreductase n=1 Tax=Lentibacter algarum TaxID=576131 RepID=UPI001C09BB2A|nr:glucose 1-dehydrogenase [Lentibacter algarum]MBU2983084.1 glucose 1-dehydrogenase [Lentibacter algarum]
MFLLNGEIAVVTGAGQGNGAAIAEGMASAGALVVLIDINKETVEQVRDKIIASGGEAVAYQLDVTDQFKVNALRVTISKEVGAVSILVNNAGIIRRTEIDSDTYEDDWDLTFAVNVTGAKNMVRAFLPDLIETSGSVINLASIMSIVAGPSLTAYAASKGAIAQFTKALAQDMAPHGVRVNAILPGVIETPMTQVTRDTPEAIARFMAHTPLKRVGQPTELVGPVIFLASNAASYVTGALLPVDGGYLTA